MLVNILDMNFVMHIFSNKMQSIDILIRDTSSQVFRTTLLILKSDQVLSDHFI